MSKLTETEAQLFFGGVQVQAQVTGLDYVVAPNLAERAMEVEDGTIEFTGLTLWINAVKTGNRILLLSLAPGDRSGPFTEDSLAAWDNESVILGWLHGDITDHENEQVGDGDFDTWIAEEEGDRLYHARRDME
jgi:hypothetical protein